MFWNELKNDGRYYLLTGKLNEDPIENFFSLMRALSGFNFNPTAMQFRKNFQHGTIFPPLGANCKPDECMTLLTNYTEVIKNRKSNESDTDDKANEINAQLQAWTINEYYDEDY